MSTFDNTQFLAGSAFVAGTAAGAFAAATNVISDGAIKGPSVGRTSAGVYTLPLQPGGPSDGLSSTEHHVVVTSRTLNIIAQVVWTSAQLLTINTTLGSTGAATDADIDVVVLRTRRVGG